MGLRGRARRAGVAELERWAITCTAYGPGRSGRLPRDDEDFRTRRAARNHPAARGQERGAAARAVDGKWILFHRPKTEYGGTSRGEIVLSRSTDMISWSAPEQVLQPREGAWWDSLRIGIGPPPLRTEHGWLLIYHGVKETVSGGVYRVGLALSTSTSRRGCCTGSQSGCSARPRPTSARGTFPTSSSRAGWSTTSRPTSSGSYYGAADTSICLATARLGDLLAAVLAAPG